MDTLDFEKEFSEWVLIKDSFGGASAPATDATNSLATSSPRTLASCSRDGSSVSVNGDVIFSLPEHIILSVLRYSSTDPHALFRTISLVCKQFSVLAKKLPLQFVFRSPITQKLPNCKIVALTVTTPVTSELIRLIGTKYGGTLRILKISQLNTTREAQLNEDSLYPLHSLTKLHQLSLAWKASPNMGSKAFAFLSHLKRLRKLSLEIYEKGNQRSPTTTWHANLPLLSYNIPPTDTHEHSNSCPRCPYSVIPPLARLPTETQGSSSTTLVVSSPISSPSTSLHSSSASSPCYSPLSGSGPMLSHPQPAKSPTLAVGSATSSSTRSYSPISSQPNSPASSPNSSDSNHSNQASFDTKSTFTSTFADQRGVSLSGSSEEPLSQIQKATSAGIPHSPADPSVKRSKMIQSSPGHHVKPVQTITTAGTTTPAPVSILKLLADNTELEDLTLSNWRDFGPLYQLAPLAKIATLTIKGRPSDLMTDGASVADASKHFLFLATLPALSSLTLAWIPPCLPQLTRLSTLDLSQAPNLDNSALNNFSRTLVNLTTLSLHGLVSGGLITDEGVQSLSRLPYLISLDMSHHHLITEAPFATMNWALVDLRLNNTSVSSLAPFTHFAPTLLHLHLSGCELLPIRDVAFHLPSFPSLHTFKLINGSISTLGGINDHLLCSFLENTNLVCLYDRVIASTRSISILSGLKALQYLELCGDNPAPRQSEVFEPLSFMVSLQSLVLTDIPLTASIIGHLSKLPLLACLTATRVDDSASAAKAILHLTPLRVLCVNLPSSHLADLWIKYVVRLPNLTHYLDGQKSSGDLPWATRRRLYLEWHPRAIKMKRANNCTIS